MKKTLVLAVGLVALVLGGASLAWACTPQASLGAFTPFEAPPGTVVTVTGSTFEDGPVEIRWGGRDGPVIGMAQGPNFSTSITIPPATPGVYYVAAVSYDEFGEFTSRAKPFEVIAPEIPVRPTKPVDQGPVDQGPVDQGPVDQVPVSGGPMDQAPVPQPAANDGAGSDPGASAPVGTAAPVDRSTGRDTIAEPIRVPAAVDPAPEGAGAPAPVPSDVALARPSPEMVSGDLWSGFAAGPDAPAPASLTDEPSSSSRPASTLAVGIALLAAGLFALFAGAVATMTARRRSLADADQAAR